MNIGDVASQSGLPSKTIRHLVNKCHGDNRPDCPILDDLAQTDAVPL